jgi:hypothetical protein
MIPAPTTAPAATPLLSYPGHWESDVVLADGSVVHLRPIVPDDDVPELAELDLNPVVVSTEGALAVDARIRLARPPVRLLPGTRRLG